MYHEYNKERVYSRNLGQCSILTRKGTFLSKKVTFLKKQAQNFQNFHKENWYKSRVLVLIYSNFKKGMKQMPFMTPFSKVLQNSFKVIYRYQTAINFLHFQRFACFTTSNPILCFIFQNSGIFLLWRHYLQIDWKGPKVVYHVWRVTERSKSIFDVTF